MEGTGEDPYLGSLVAAARVRGLQGDDLGAVDTLLVCAKHYAACGSAKGGRDCNVADVSERTLREIYLPTLQGRYRCQCADPCGRVQRSKRHPVTCKSYLLNDVLREQWGFKGLVVSD